MRVRSVGPLQERVLRTGRRLRVRGLKAPRPRIKLPTIHRPSLHTPSITLPRPSIRAPRDKVVGGIKLGAARLRRRGEEQDVEPADPELLENEPAKP